VKKCKKYVTILIVVLLFFTVFWLYYKYFSLKQEEILDINRIKSWAYQLQNADPNEIANSGFDLVVIDYSRDGTEQMKYSPSDIAKIKQSGIIPICYISIGEAEDYRFYWNESWYDNPPEWLGHENPDWPECYAVKYWYEEWKEIVFAYLDKIIEQGFCGVYLDKVDEFEYWADPENGEGEYYSENQTAKWMIEFICEIANYCRSKAGENFYVIPQNGERLLEYDNGTLLNIVSGWAVEDLFYNETEPLPENITQERIQYLDKVHSRGKIVLVVDYVDDGTGYKGENKERIDDFIAKAREKGYIPYAARSDRALDELNIIEGVQPPSKISGNSFWTCIILLAKKHFLT